MLDALGEFPCVYFHSALSILSSCDVSIFSTDLPFGTNRDVRFERDVINARMFFTSAVQQQRGCWWKRGGNGNIR